MSLTTDAILFSINSAIKLGRNLHRAYALSLRSKNLVLPLPGYNRDVKETTIEFFFDSKGKEFLGKINRLDELHRKAKTSELEDDELEEYRQFYGVFFGALNPGTAQAAAEPAAFLEAREIVHLFTIRQWERGEAPRRTALQLVAGTIVEIGIDYFQSVPGALNADSTQGRAVQSFLTAIDDISFSEETDLKALLSRRIVPNLFITAVETLGEMSTEIARDEKLQRFIQTTSKSIASDLFQRLEKVGDGQDPDEVINWGRVIMSSLIRNAGHYVFTSADHLFGTNEAESKLIESTGLTLMSLLFDKTDDSINLRNVLTAEGLDTIVRASLSVIGEHPELLSRQEGIRQIIGGVSSALSQSGLRRPDLLPELVRLILENTAGNLHLLWKAEAGEAEHLLLTTVTELLSLLSRPVPGNQWRPQLSRSQILELATLLVDEVVNNPDWALRKTDEQSTLGQILRLTFDSLRTIPPQERLTPETLEWIIQVNLRMVVTAPRVLEAVRFASDDEEKVILQQAMDLALSFVFSPDPATATPKVYRLQLLKELLEYTFNVVLSRHPDQKGLILIDLILFKEAGLDFSQGFDPEWADRLIDAALRVLNQHPELIGNKEGLRDIVSGVAGALRQTDLKDRELLPELIRIVLENTAAHLPLIIKTEGEKLDNILVLALQQTLAAISQKADDDTRWRPRLTGAQVLEISELVFEEVLANPRWVQEGSLVQKLLEGAFTALRHTAAGEKPSFDLLRILVIEALGAGQQNMAFMKEIQFSFQNTDLAITVSLQEFVLVIYNKDLDKEIRWTLNQANVVEALLEVFLARIQRGGATADAVKEAADKLKSIVNAYVNQTLTTVDELLGTLEEV